MKLNRDTDQIQYKKKLELYNSIFDQAHHKIIATAENHGYGANLWLLYLNSVKLYALFEYEA
jgi:hypothetical protein